MLFNLLLGELFADFVEGLASLWQVSIPAPSVSTVFGRHVPCRARGAPRW